MNNKIRLNILGLSYSQSQTGAYALVLVEEEGNRRIPIIIGAAEAQSIAIQLEGLTPLRPLTHDLFVSLAQAYQIHILEVVIHKLEEGIFYSVLICECQDKVVKIDARTSDAVALALRFRCPIYTLPQIMDKAGIVFESDDSNKETKESEDDTKDLTRKSIDDLQNLLQEAIDKENYELASQIRDELKRREE